MFRFFLVVLVALALPVSAHALTAKQLDAVYEQATYDPATQVNVRCFYTWEGFMERSPISPYQYGGYLDGTAYLGDYICKRLRYIVEGREPRERIETGNYPYAVFALAHEVSHYYSKDEDATDCRAAQTFDRVARGLGVRSGARRDRMAAQAMLTSGYSVARGDGPVPCWPT